MGDQMLKHLLPEKKSGENNYEQKTKNKKK